MGRPDKGTEGRNKEQERLKKEVEEFNKKEKEKDHSWSQKMNYEDFSPLYSL